MNNHILKSFIIFFALNICFILESHSQLNPESGADKPKKDNYWNSLFNGNIDRSFEKKFDVSFVLTPSYAREPSFGIGGMTTGLYRLDRTDSILPPSDITLTYNLSVKGFYSLTAVGNNNFKGHRSRLSYQVAFFNKNLDFWGINYDDCSVNPAIVNKQQTAKVYADYRYKVLKDFYVAANVDFQYRNASKIDDFAYLNGQKKSFITTGIGFSLQYDSRDFIPNPKRGAYLSLRETVYPEIFGNTKRTLLRTTLNANYYQQLWTGSVLAFDMFGQVSANNLPWTLREELGGIYRMRGYYTGRYMDNNIVSSQVELRQHVAGRIGAVVWAGGGTVFPTLQKFDMKNLLPKYGLGFRFEIKRNVNGRIDYGFGKGTSGFVLNISEAF